MVFKDRHQSPKLQKMNYRLAKPPEHFWPTTFKEPKQDLMTP